MVSERRGALRHPLERPAKLRDPATGRYLAARTINHSDTGLLVELPTPTGLGPGQSVQVAIAQPRQGIIPATDLRDATVVRVPASTPFTRLALRYAAAHRLAA